MEEGNTVCPVCTLYLRPGMTLKSHLDSHPKQKVIEALVRLATAEEIETPKITTVNVPSWNGPSTSNVPGNHSFIYQQFMSSSAPQNVLSVNQMGQQYVTIPAVFNPQMMCQPYVYQQQQVIMSSGGLPPMPRLLPIQQAEPPQIQVHASSEHIQEIIDNIVEVDENQVDSPADDLVVFEKDDDDDEIKDDDDEEEEEEEAEIDEEKIEEVEEIEESFDEVDKNEHNMSLLEVNVSNYTEESCLDSPGSTSSDYIRVRKDLNKSCQTQNDEATYVTLTSTPEEIANNAMVLDSNLLDMDGMNLMLTTDFMQNQIIAPVEDFEYNIKERSQELTNIGDYENQESIDSVNIRADEHMPPRGELSGQESNASDMAWSRVHENNYDLIARETWDNNSDDECEMPPLQSRDPADDIPTISGFSEPMIQYKCPKCDEHFNCPKERKTHLTEKHDNEIGTKIGKKKVKKLIIKPKKVDDVKSENNFDFTNKLKIEEMEIGKTVILNLDKKEEPVTPIKTINNPVVCTLCETILEDNNALKQHQLEVHNFNTNERYKCNICQESFQNEPKYTEHLAIHPLECRLCGKYFYRRQNMQLHMKRHLGIRPYRCTICDKGFLTKQKLEEHRNIHTGDAPIKCNLCHESFRRHSNLVQHRNRHHLNIKRKVKDYICHCSEVFHSKKKLAWHKETHDNKPKSCKHCSEKFIHSSSLTRHMRRAHNERFVPREERLKENVECPICKGIFLRSSLDVHIRTHSGQRPYTCSICNKDFTTKWNLKLHKWTHAARASKPFKCDLCKGAFIRESDYTAHMNSHKAVRPYTCNHCGAQFIRKYNCQRHVKEHEKGKTFTCTVCSKSFHRSYYLKDHMRIHSGVRPYGCHICGKTSATKSNHNKHVRIHHAREPVSTEN